MASITLSPELSARVEQVAKEHGQDARAYAEALLQEALGPPFVVNEVEAVKEALEASAHRQGRTLDEWYADFKSRQPNGTDRPA